MPISPDRILYRDDHLLAVHKLPGELVVKGSGKLEKLPLLDFLKKTYPGLHPLQRLDFETSGVVVFARSSKILKKVLDTKFDQWKKTYLAVVMGVPRTGAGLRSANVIRFPLPSRIKGEKIDAVTEYRLIEEFAVASEVEAVITTGRHHQIRRHFAMIGHPLVLDDEYGDRTFNQRFARQFKYRRFFLHAAAVAFPHPVTGKMMTVEAAVPRSFEEIRRKLKIEN